jgi:hypothetical protein
VTVGDFTGDGKLDIAVLGNQNNSDEGVINVFLGNGDGTFQDAVGYDTGEYPRAVEAVDLNGDGTMDLVVANIGNSSTGETGSVAVLLGNGDGTFRAATQYTPFDYPGWRSATSTATAAPTSRSPGCRTATPSTSCSTSWC